jgi:hypothetical protein
MNILKRFGLELKIILLNLSPYYLSLSPAPPSLLLLKKERRNKERKGKERKGYVLEKICMPGSGEAIPLYEKKLTKISGTKKIDF